MRLPRLRSIDDYLKLYLIKWYLALLTCSGGTFSEELSDEPVAPSREAN